MARSKVRHTSANAVPPAAVRRAGLRRLRLASRTSDLPPALAIPGGGKVILETGQVGEKTGFRFPPQPVSWIDFERVLSLQNKHAGKRFLIVGAGPSSLNWEKYHRDGDIIIACNSAILMLKDVADYFLCTEGNGYELGWFWVETKATKIVSYCNLKWPQKEPRTMAHAADAIPIERSWHLAGFDPRVYFNATPIDSEVWNSAERNLYSKHRTFIGVDRYTAREWGLLKGPVCWPGNMSIGTVCVNGAHLAGFMGAAEIASIGFEFHMANGAHATEPKFVYKTSRWATPDCFMRVNGKPTMWHFALSAAFAVKLRPVFKKAGIDWQDYSGGLQDIPGIEGLLKEVHGKPHDVTLKEVAKPPAKFLAPVAVSEEPATPGVPSDSELQTQLDGATILAAITPPLEAENGEEALDQGSDGEAGAPGADNAPDAPQVAKPRAKPGPKPGSRRKKKEDAGAEETGGLRKEGDGDGQGKKQRVRNLHKQPTEKRLPEEGVEQAAEPKG